MNSVPSAFEHLMLAHGRNVRLRLKCLDDAPNDYRWNCDPEIARLNHRAITDESYAQYAARLESELRFVNPRERTFAIEGADGVHIGNVMYYNVAGDRAEIGLTIGSEPHRRRGLGRDAVVVLLRHLFETTAFRAITLHTLASNAPALRCFRACGFEETGQVEQRGAQLIAMAVRREYWLLDDARGRFAFDAHPQRDTSRRYHQTVPGDTVCHQLVRIPATLLSQEASTDAAVGSEAGAPNSRHSS